jgi:hypothetical protein
MLLQDGSAVWLEGHVAGPVPCMERRPAPKRAWVNNEGGMCNFKEDLIMWGLRVRRRRCMRGTNSTCRAQTRVTSCHCARATSVLPCCLSCVAVDCSSCKAAPARAVPDFCGCALKRDGTFVCESAAIVTNAIAHLLTVMQQRALAAQSAWAYIILVCKYASCICKDCCVCVCVQCINNARS